MEQNNLDVRDAPQPPAAADAGVWPPPPTGGTPAGAAIASVFSPVRRLAREIRVLLGVCAASAALGIAGALLPLPTSYRQIVSGLVALTQGLLLLGMGLCFLVWTYRLNKNLRALGVAGVRYAPAWAVAYFFIPILSLYRPYQVFREIWRASDPGPAALTDQAWQNGRSPALLGFWWASVILLAFQVVRLVTARQEQAARFLSLIL